MNIESYIADLLYEHQCVVLPGVGGFVVNQQTAQIDPINHTIYPPSKVVSFNPNLKNNDGLLTKYVADNECIPYTTSSDIVSAYCNDICTSLKEQKVVQIEDVGTLSQIESGLIDFMPSDVNFDLQSYGMQPLDCFPIYRKKELIHDLNEKNRQASLKRMTDNSVRPMPTWIKRGAVACIFLLLVGVPFFNNVFTTDDLVVVTESDPSETTDFTGSILPVHDSQAQSNNSSNTTNSDESKEEIPDNPSPTPQQVDDSGTELESSDPQKKPSAVESAEIETSSYKIVMGAFGKEKNALKLKDRLEASDYTVTIQVLKNKLNRVIIHVDIPSTELNTTLQEIRQNHNPKAWLL